MTRLISLLVAVATVGLFSTPGFAQSPTYTWQLGCANVAPPVGGIVAVTTAVDWYWISNGQPIVGAGSSAEWVRFVRKYSA